MIEENLNWLRSLSVGQVFWSVIASIMALGCYMAYSHIHLYADGAHFLLNILTDQSVFTPRSSRFVANEVQQLLPIAVISMGMVDIEIISFLYGINLFAVPIIGVVISYFILEKRNVVFIAFPILSLLFIVHNNFTFITSELYVTTALFWPLLFYSLFGEFSKLGKWVFVITLLTLGQTHELAWPLMVVIGFASFSRLPQMDISTGVLMVVGVLASFILCINWSIYPGSPGVENGIVQQLGGLLSFKQYPLSLLFILCTILLSLSDFKRIIKYMLIGLLGVAGILMLLPVINSSNLMYPIIHWEQRIIIGLITFLSGCLTAWLVLINRDIPNIDMTKMGIVVLTILVLCYQLKMTLLWNNYTNELEKSLSQHTGILDYHETSIAQDETLNQFSTAWTQSSLGLLLATFKNPEVRTLLSMPRGKWQPWHARDFYGRPDLSSYNVRYRLFGPNIFID